MTEQPPVRENEDTVEQVNAKIARNASEMEAIQESLSGRVAAREEFKRQKGQPLEPHMLERGLRERFKYLESEQRRLTWRRKELGQ